MNHFFTRLKDNVVGILGLIVFLVLFIFGIFIFSYILIFIAAIGSLLFLIGYIRFKWLMHKAKKRYQSPANSGRIIEHDDCDHK